VGASSRFVYRQQEGSMSGSLKSRCSHDLVTNTSDKFLSKDTRCESWALELQSLFRNLIATRIRAVRCSGSAAAQDGTEKK